MDNSENTTKCPYCGEEILKEAKKCKHCGEWLDKNEEDSRKTEVKPQEDDLEDENITSNIWSKTIEWIIFLAIGVGAYFFVSNKIEERNKQKREYFQERKEQWERKTKQIDNTYFKPYNDGMKKLQEDYKRERNEW